MSLNRGMASIVEAINEGKYHFQRFTKNASLSFATGWVDASYSSGQPAYDARVGTALTFTPAIASKNDAIYFPAINSNETRYLGSCTFRGSQSGATSEENVIVFDLLGYYPLIDGDSTDPQEMDNTLTLPRYSTGEGVYIMLVNHVAPTLQNGIATIVYQDSNGVEQTAPNVTVPLTGIGMVSNGQDPVSNTIGSPFIPLANGSRGVRKIISLTFTVPPSGLICAYLVKPLLNFTGLAGTSNNNLAREKCNCSYNGFNMPIIYDGAWLSFIHYHTGTARTTAWFGDFTFIWK